MRKPMISTLAVALAVLAVLGMPGLVAQALRPGTQPSWARGFEGQRKADLGNGTYLNPIMAGDHPDPSVLKDGDDYYMTFSSFDAYPCSVTPAEAGVQIRQCEAAFRYDVCGRKSSRMGVKMSTSTTSSSSIVAP